MVEVQLKEKESLERALRRFKKQWERAGILKEVRNRSFYVKPSDAKREARKKQYGGWPEMQELKPLETIPVQISEEGESQSLLEDNLQFFYM